MNNNSSNLHHVVIVGGGFGGLYVAKELGREENLRITLIDKRNFHLFQPLLYQVATGGLSPGDIASPLRAILKKNKNTKVIRDKVIDILPNEKAVSTKAGKKINYDTLIIATGVRYNYFGNKKWLAIAPPVKTMEDALGIRHRIFHAFEQAELEENLDARNEWMRFIIVGAGPTGVELAGALGELAHFTLKDDFRNFNTKDTEIILIEAADRILPNYPENLSKKAHKALIELGVTIKTDTFVTNLKENEVALKNSDSIRNIKAQTILWAAGVKATKIGEVLEDRLKAKTDSAGRVHVNPDLSVNQNKDIFVIGDLAYLNDKSGNPLPGVAPVAMQQGKYVANLLKKRLIGEDYTDFTYKDKGSLAVIGRNKAVADLGFLKFDGFFAWLVWVFIHIRYLIEYDNKLLVIFQWAWNYFTMKRGARLITGDDPFPYMDADYYAQTEDK